MPTKSVAQHRLMEAAAHTLGGYGGVPQRVGKEFVGKDMASSDWRGLIRGLFKWVMEEEQEPEHQGEDEAPKIAAGVVLRTIDGKVLLLKRSGTETNYKGHWALPGGGAEPGEDGAAAAIRECQEETGFTPEGLTLLKSVKTPTGMVFHTYEAPVKGTFAPKLNGEHTEHGWFGKDDLPTPMHPRVAELLSPPGRPAQDTFAMDKDSVRSIDADGRMHVSRTPLSKANVCEYLGKEIPESEALGLDPDKKYRLLRDPEELKKAAKSFNNMPLLSRHVPMDAESHDPDLVIGSTGTDAEFEDPYLYNSLVFWKKEDIDDIEDDRKKELSAAYRYRYDPTPGTFRGEAYDGVMRDIVGNHQALVTKGRAGPDVVVGDSAPEQETIIMTNKLLSRKAAVILGALVGHIRPRLATDTAIDFEPILSDVTAENFSSKKKSIAATIATRLKGRLAADANLDDMHALLDSLDRTDPAEAADAETAKENSEGEEDDGAEDAEESAREKAMDAMRKSGMDEKEIEACDAAMRGARDQRRAADARRRMGRDETKEEEEARRDKEKKAEDRRKSARDAARAKDTAPEKQPPGITKKAMDEAIASAEKRATDNAIKRQRSIVSAQNFASDWVGAMDGAFESEADVYKAALDVLEVRLAADVHPTALRAILEAQPKPGARRSERMAQDSSGDSDFFTKLCPDAARIQNL